MVKYKNSLWMEQLKRRIGKPVWVSKIGMHFWPDITKGRFRTITAIERQNNGEVVVFSDGTKLLGKELGTMWVAFDEQQFEKDLHYVSAPTVRELKELVAQQNA